MLLRLLVGLKLAITYPKLVFFNEANNIKIFPLESLLLEEMYKRVDKETASIIKSQILEINLIERVYKPKTVVSFNKIRRASYSSERLLKIKSFNDDFCIRKILFKAKDKESEVSFYIVKGDFYSMEFNRNISSIIYENKITLI